MSGVTGAGGVSDGGAYQSCGGGQTKAQARAADRALGRVASAGRGVRGGGGTTVKSRTAESALGKVTGACGAGGVGNSECTGAGTSGVTTRTPR